MITIRWWSWKTSCNVRNRPLRCTGPGLLKTKGPRARGPPSIPDGQLLPGSGCRGLGISLRGNFASRIAAW